jgi:arsenical pump membrane protein
MIGVVLAFGLARNHAFEAARQTWPPFALVTGLLLIGVVANEDGVFAAAAGTLSGFARRPVTLYLAAMLLVAVVTALLNLDTSAAFLTPVLVQVARLRGAGQERFLYGCIFMSNAASLLLPGSNLTNLLVLANQPINGAAFLAQMAAPWMASVLVTIIVVALVFPRSTDAGPSIRFMPRPLQALSVAATLIAVCLILVLTSSALPVLAVGGFLVVTRLAQRRLSLSQVKAGVDVLSVLGIYLVAVALGTVARSWTYPGELLHHASTVSTAAIAAVASVLMNNLPAAVLLGSNMPAHPQSLLFGLNIGPNLAVTGSLSALIWWQAAKSVGLQPSALRYSAVGIILAPVTIAAALVTSRIFG